MQVTRKGKEERCCVVESGELKVGGSDGMVTLK